MKLQHIRHQFLEFIPEKLEPGTLYISIEYGASTHLCCCGCGYEVSNPITPTDWNFTYNGASVSLSPSIGNSSFPCKSHYWIDGDRVVWEAPMTPHLTAASRARDKVAKSKQFTSTVEQLPIPELQEQESVINGQAPAQTWWAKVRRFFS